MVALGRALGHERMQEQPGNLDAMDQTLQDIRENISRKLALASRVDFSKSF